MATWHQRSSRKVFSTHTHQTGSPWAVFSTSYSEGKLKRVHAVFSLEPPRGIVGGREELLTTSKLLKPHLPT